MIYVPATGEAKTMTQSSTVEDFTANPKIRSARRTLLVLISIQLVWIIFHWLISDLELCLFLLFKVIAILSGLLGILAAILLSTYSHANATVSLMSLSGVYIILGKLSTLVWLFMFFSLQLFSSYFIGLFLLW
jgi:hypothetical protein